MMRRGLFFAPALLASAALLAGSAFAGGFRIPEQGAAAMGQANAFVGQADDASAVQFNPAGITQLPGNNLLLGGTSITVKSRYTSTGGVSTDMKDTSAFPPIFYYTNHLGTGNWWLGLGVTSPFGLASDWAVPTFEYMVTKTNLEMAKINPALGYKINDRISLGFGVDYYQVLEATFENAVPFGPIPSPLASYVKGNQKLSADGTAYGFNLGGLFRLADNASLGLSYRTGADVELSGDVTLSSAAATLAGTGKTTLKLPPTAALGLCYRPTADWKVNLDLDWTGWSAYDELAITSTLPGKGTATKILAKDYKDTTAIRVGASYALDPNWILRGGVLIDSTPVPNETYDPRLPDGDRTGYSLGAGYKSGPWSVDLAAMYVQVKKFDVDNNLNTTPFSAYSPAPYTVIPALIPGTPAQTVDGSYKGSITLIGFNVGYSF